MIENLPIPKDISEYFSYNPDTGVITRIKSKKKNHLGVVGSVTSDGYLTIGLNYNGYQAHRIAWYLYYKEDPGDKVVDHKDGNRLNNKIENLRLLDVKPNSQYRANDLGYRYIEELNLFQVNITSDKRKTKASYHSCPLLARIEYIKKINDLHPDTPHQFVRS